MLALENYIKECTNTQAAIFGYLREIILSFSPDIEEDISADKPFYHSNGAVCYINNDNAGTSLSFCNGTELYDPSGVLKPAERFEEKKIHYNSKRDVNPDVVLTILQQAIKVNKINAAPLMMAY
jgi:hypothetical protein